MGKGIKGLSPEAWEAFKWQLPELFHPIILKDNKNPNGNYDPGEAYIKKNSHEEPLSVQEAAILEDTLLKTFQEYDPQQINELARRGVALKAVIDGKCLDSGYKLRDCHAREVSDSASFLASVPFPELRYYAKPLKVASDSSIDNVEVAFAAGEALTAAGYLLAAVPYYLRANAYANFVGPKIRLTMIAYELKDWGAFKKYLDENNSKEFKTVIEAYVLKSGDAKKSSPEDLLKSIYAVQTFFPEKREQAHRWINALPKDEKTLNSLLEKYPDDFKKKIKQLRRGE